MAVGGSVAHRAMGERPRELLPLSPAARADVVDGRSRSRPGRSPNPAGRDRISGGAALHQIFAHGDCDGRLPFDRAGEHNHTAAERAYGFARELADSYAVMERGEVVLAGKGAEMVESDVRRYLTV